MEHVAGNGVLRAPGEGKSFWVLDEYMRFLVTGEDTGGAYTITESIVPPGGGPPQHIHHREEEGFWIVEGELEVRVGCDIFIAAQGSYIHLPRGIPHTFRNTGDVSAKFLTMLVPAGLESFFERLGIRSEDPTTMPEIEPGVIAELMALAPEYGLEILLHDAPPE